MGTLARAGRDKLTIFLSREISTFGLWIEQLVAESTGKDGTGVVPVSNEPPAAPGSYGDDRLFVYTGAGLPDPGTSKTLKALAEAGHPVLSFILKDPYELGGEMLKWEVATAVAGRILGINPFDQPDVEIAKKMPRQANGAEKAAKASRRSADGTGPLSISARPLVCSTQGQAAKAMERFLGLVAKSTISE
jgi:glucose-6-phosphate isomerase